MTKAFETVVEDGLPVQLPSGATFYVLTQDEVDYIHDRVNRYLADNHFVNVSDLQDVDRMVVMECLVHRWSLWLSRDRDYFGDAVDSKALRGSVNDYCVDDETEIFTRDGWTDHSELLVGAEVLTLRGDGQAEWQPIEAVHRFAKPTPVAEIRTRDHWSVTTMNHRWPVRKVDQRLPSGRGGIEYVETWQLNQRHSLILSAIGGASTVPKYDDSLVELLAWYWTEGHSHPHPNGNAYNTSVSQSWKVNPLNCERIEACLTSLFGTPLTSLRGCAGARWSPKRRDRGVTEYMLSKEAAGELATFFSDFRRKVLHPRTLMDFTQAQLALFVEISIKADGWLTSWGTRSGVKIGRRLFQGVEARSKNLEVACVLLGVPVRTVKTSTGWRTVLVQDRACVPIRALKLGGHSPDYRVANFVWCPQTANGTWLARRKGSIFYTGNSTEVRQLKKSLGIDKVARDKQKGDDSVNEYLAQLRVRAKEFGVMREGQLNKALELFQQLKMLVTLHENSDDIERREMRCSMDDIMEWMRTVAFPEFDEIDAHFREHQQKFWVRRQ